MLYIALVRNRQVTVQGTVDLAAKSRKWWSEPCGSQG